MASKTVDEVRKALEEIGAMTVPEDAAMSGEARIFAMISQAVVKEGLKALDDHEEVKAEYEKALKDRDDSGYREYILRGMRAGGQQINLIAAILRSAGRMK